jgi:hypothetical protein
MYVYAGRIFSGEDVVGPVAVDAGRLRRRLEDDVDGVDDAGDVAEQRQQQGDEELRLRTQRRRR